jgi:hypothetical protein
MLVNDFNTSGLSDSTDASGYWSTKTEISTGADWERVEPNNLVFQHNGERIEFSFDELKRLKQILKEKHPEDYL